MSEGNEKIHIAALSGSSSGHRTEYTNLGHPKFRRQFEEGGPSRSNDLGDSRTLRPRFGTEWRGFGSIPRLGLTPRTQADGGLSNPPDVAASVASQETRPEFGHNEAPRAMTHKSYFESKLIAAAPGGNPPTPNIPPGARRLGRGSRGRESNPRPAPYQGAALPTEPPRHGRAPPSRLTSWPFRWNGASGAVGGYAGLGAAPLRARSGR